MKNCGEHQDKLCALIECTADHYQVHKFLYYTLIQRCRKQIQCGEALPNSTNPGRHTH